MNEPFQLNREQRSRLFIAALSALKPSGPDDPIYSYCEAISFVEFPDEVFGLARALDGFLYPLTRDEYVTLDVRELLSDHDQTTVRCALTLAGLRQIDPLRWTTAPAGSGANARRLALPPDFLENHL